MLSKPEEKSPKYTGPLDWNDNVRPSKSHVTFENETKVTLYQAPGTPSDGPGLVHLQLSDWNPETRVNHTTNLGGNADNVYLLENASLTEEFINDVERQNRSGDSLRQTYDDSVAGLGMKLVEQSQISYTSDP